VQFSPVESIARPPPTRPMTGPRSINAYLVEMQDFTAAALGGEGGTGCDPKSDPLRRLLVV
jgi:hypothetical protein